MRFSKEQLREAKRKAVRRYGNSRKWLILLVYVLGIAVGIALMTLPPVYAFVKGVAR